MSPHVPSANKQPNAWGRGGEGEKQYNMSRSHLSRPEFCNSAFPLFVASILEPSRKTLCSR